MGLLDKLKSAANAVTGKAATVELTFDRQLAFPGETVGVVVQITAAGRDLQSKGVFVDIRGVERVELRKRDHNNVSEDLVINTPVMEETIKIWGDHLAPVGATVKYEGSFVVPPAMPPSFRGRYATHVFEVRGRVEAFGNDPDSGFVPLTIGRR